MKVVRSLFLFIIAGLGFLVGTSLTIPLAWFSRDKTRVYQRSARIWARLLAYLSGIPVKLEGRYHVPRKQAVVFVSNHQGAADILLLLAYLPVNFRFIVKKELFKIPFFGWYLKKAGYLSVERGVGEKAHRLFSEAQTALKSGENILIFPEGTRSRDGKLQPFKRGSLLLAFRAKAKVVPVAISGSFHILPAKTYIYNVVPVRMKISQPISLEKYGTDYERALEDIREIIAKQL